CDKSPLESGARRAGCVGMQRRDFGSRRCEASRKPCGSPMSAPPIFAAVAARTLAWPDYLALAAYFALSLGIGWWWRRKKQSSGQFILGDRQLPWWAAAISFMATATSSISFM